MVNQDTVDALLRDFPNLSRTIATYLVALDEQDPKFLQRELAGRLTGAEKRAFKPLPAAKVEKLAQVLRPELRSGTAAAGQDTQSSSALQILDAE